MRASPNDPRQAVLFAEIVEFTTTPDMPFEDGDGCFGLHIVRPRGKGWRPLPIKHQPERRTHWMRRRAVIRTRRKASRGGGGWRQL